ncbi:MAG: M55 family metallopeptidase [Planctomycetota bacterium]
MKIYVHTDLEGVSGIDNMDMIQIDDARFQESRERLTEDVNAAVAGAFEGGAKHVTVLDSHGSGVENIIWEKVDKRAERDTKPTKKWWGILDETYDATFFIGAHAMAGTINGFLDHTQSSRSVYNWYYNGRKCGELAQWALVAGHFGVPLVMVSGDEAAVAEAHAFFNPVETAAVKRGKGRNFAVLYDHEDAHGRIREAARSAIPLAAVAKPFTMTLPIEVVLDLNRSDYADETAKGEGVERIDARRVRKIAESALDILL